MKPLLQALAEVLPNATLKRQSASPENFPPQETLQGDPELVRKAIAATPNTSAICPSRDAYVEYGIAVKAALAGQPDAFDVWWEWCERWVDGAPNYDLAVGDWMRMKPPFRVGASYLYEIADKHSGGKFDRAEVWFDQAAATYEPLFPDSTGQNPENGEKSVATLYELLTVEDLFNRPDPVFMIDRHVPEHSVGFLYGDPGTGKSFLALDMALHIAFGRGEWHGDAIRTKPGAAVIYLAGEGASGFKTRVAAWMDRHKIPQHERSRFALLPQGVNFMLPDDVRRLAATLKEKVVSAEVGVGLIVVDTVSRSMPGADENLQKEMTLFVKACDVLRDEFACCVMGVHHAGKSGDMRGSTVLTGAGDFVFKLERKKGANIGHLHCEKQKDAPDGWSEPYRFDVVGVGEGRSSLVPTRVEASEGAAIGSLKSEVSAAILKAIEDDWKAGDPWSMKPQAGRRYGVRHMVKRFGVSADNAEAILGLWFSSGVIREENFDGRNKLKGIRVTKDAGQNVQAEAGLFD